MRKKIFTLSQTTKEKHFAKIKIMNASQNEKIAFSQTMNKKHSVKVKISITEWKFFAFFQTVIKTFWESESDKCIAETLLLQSVHHCTATAAPRLIRRRRKKKLHASIRFQSTEHLNLIFLISNKTSVFIFPLSAS